jgi:hypothetical protein
VRVSVIQADGDGGSEQSHDAQLQVLSDVIYELNTLETVAILSCLVIANVLELPSYVLLGDVWGWDGREAGRRANWDLLVGWPLIDGRSRRLGRLWRHLEGSRRATADSRRGQSVPTTRRRLMRRRFG